METKDIPIPISQSSNTISTLDVETKIIVVPGDMTQSIEPMNTTTSETVVAMMPVETSVPSTDESIMTHAEKMAVVLEHDNDLDISSSSESEVESVGADLQLTGDLQRDHEILQSLMSRVGDDADDDDEDGAGSGNAPRTQNEILINDLPLESRESLKVDADVPLAVAGTVSSVVGTMLVIKAPSGAGARVLNMGSILCLSDRTPLGKLDEIFGPVADPFYVVRFASHEEIQKLGIEAEKTSIFYPSNNTHFLVPETLVSQGSDASSRFDEEPNVAEIDYSDDEEEAAAKAKTKANRKQERGGGKGRKPHIAAASSSGSTAATVARHGSARNENNRVLPHYSAPNQASVGPHRYPGVAASSSVMAPPPLPPPPSYRNAWPGYPPPMLPNSTPMVPMNHPYYPNAPTGYYHPQYPYVAPMQAPYGLSQPYPAPQPQPHQQYPYPQVPSIQYPMPPEAYFPRPPPS